MKGPDSRLLFLRGGESHNILIISALDLVIVHRVNTDMDGRSVSSADFGELVRISSLLMRR